MSGSVHHPPSRPCPYNQSTPSQSNTNSLNRLLFKKASKKTLQQSMTPIPNKGVQFTPASKGLTVPISAPPMRKILSQSEISQTKTKVSDISQAESDVPIAPPRLRRKKSPLNAKAVDETKATGTSHVESNKMITHAETKSSNQHPKKLLTLSVFSRPLPGRPGPPTRPPPLTSSYRPNRPPPPKINTKCVTLTHNQPVGKIPNCTSSTIIKTKYVTEGPVDMLKQLVQKPSPNRYTKKGFSKQYEGRQLPDQMTPPASCIRQPIYETVLPLKNDNDTDDDSEQEDDPEYVDMSGGYCIPEVTSTHIYGEQEDEYIEMAPFCKYFCYITEMNEII